MSSFPNQLGPGLFVPTTNVWDVSEISDIDVQSTEFKELLVRLYQNLNTISLALNLKDTGYYSETEFVNGQAYFPDPALSSTTAANPVFRQVFRKVVNFGTLPNAGTTSVAHGISFDTTFTITRLYGAATDPVALDYIPLPYASPTDADNIELNADATNINVITGSNRTAFTVSYIIVEYLKQ